MYDAIDVANHIIAYCNEMNYRISNLKLQKILYFVQADFLAQTNRACFVDEIEAWEYGPVVPRVYQKFKFYGGSDIILIGGVRHDVINWADERRINDMVDECIDYTAGELVDITHRQRPWREAYAKRRNSIISKESIKRYFEE